MTPTYDILFLNAQLSNQGATLSLDTTSNTVSAGAGASVTGTLKVAERWLLELLTEVGSMPYQPTRGSTFLTSLGQGLIDTEADAFAQFSAAVAQVMTNLALDQTSSDPPDEIITGASLVSLILGDPLIFNINLTTQGSSIFLSLPV